MLTEKDYCDMETKFNFNSQVCTSRVQSERLLALGLKKETADMAHEWTYIIDDWIVTPFKWDNNNINEFRIPAWSLHRLIELALRSILICGVSFTFGEDAYEKVINVIEWQIEDGNFNKKYLV